MSKKAKTGQPLGTRSIASLPSSVDVDKRSFDMIVTTEAPVRTLIRDPRSPEKEIEIEVDEVLLLDGLDLSRAPRMPLLDAHDVSSTSKILGKVDDVRVDGEAVVARAILSRTAMTERPELLADIEDGFFGQISAGYCVNAYELEERDGDVPLARATSWTLHEASLVPVGADPNASVRNSARIFPLPTVTTKTTGTRAEKAAAAKKRNQNMDLEALVEEAEEVLAELDEAIAEAGDDVDDALLERVKGLRRRRKREQLDDDDERKAKAKREQPDDEDERKAKAKREPGDDDDAPELTDEELDEVEEIRSAARAFGLTSYVDALASVRAKPGAIRRAVQKQMLTRLPTDTDVETPQRTQRKKRSAAPVIDTNAIYARLNKRSKSA